jgi:hypothetical protein
VPSAGTAASADISHNDDALADKTKTKHNKQVNDEQLGSTAT